MKGKTIFALAFAILTVSGSAFAQQIVNVRWNGLATSYGLNIYRNGTFYVSAPAGEFNISIDGLPASAYCVDLDHRVATSFQAEMYAAPTESPWCEIAYLSQHYDAVDNFWGAAIQLAIWKLVDSGLPGTPNFDAVTVSQAAVEAQADELVAEALGQCPLTCESEAQLTIDVWAERDGLIHGIATLTQDGRPVIGQALTLSTDKGAFVSPLFGQGTTGDEGTVEILIDLQGAAPPVTVAAEATGRSIFILDPLPAYQVLQSFNFGDPCLIDGSGSFIGRGLGDPRTIGFWKHQASVAVTGRGRAQVPASTLTSFLPLGIFDLTVETIPDLYAALWISEPAPMQVRAEQQCLATLLNYAYGELDWYSLVDTNRDGQPDAFFWQAFDAAYDAYYAGQFETAKTICDNINNL